MKRKYWLIFGWIQANGILAGFVAFFLMFPTFLLLSVLALLPGSLASVALAWHGFGGAKCWSPWTMGALIAIAVFANLLLFVGASFFLTRYRKTKCAFTPGAS
jgi:hypothetical protein